MEEHMTGKKEKSPLGLVLRGLAMGIAEVIPGVSGGTIAFITGIYGDLLNAIKCFDLDFIRNLIRGNFKSIQKDMDWRFLFLLFSGMLLGLLFGIFFISHMLENYPEILWSAFFALILASIPFMLRTMYKFNLKMLLFLIFGAMMAYIVTSLSPVTPSDNLIYIFFGGVIAIVALVLPGISGSFILLLLGLYTLIIPTLKSFITAPEFQSFTILAFFGLGCIVGLAVFARLVSAAFARFHDPTVALMSGFMLGSLNKIWPWRNPGLALDKESGEFIDLASTNLTEALTDDRLKIISEVNVLPSDYYTDPHLTGVIIVFLVAALTVSFLSRYAKNF